MVLGGVGISKTVNIGGALNVTGNSFFNGNVDISGIETIQNTTDSTGVGIGAVVIKGGVGISKTVNIGGALNVTGNSVFNGNVDISGIETIRNTTDSNGVSNGALMVLGGVGISKTVNIGGNLNVIGNSFFNGNVDISGIETIQNTTESTGVSNGAVVVKGGVGISKTVNIGGNLNITGNTFFNKNVDISGIEMIVNTTDSGSVGSGALVVSGGVGISKTMNIGGNLNVTGNSFFNKNVNISGIETIINTTDSNGVSNGALIVSGGVGISKTVNIGGGLNITGDSSMGNVTVYGIETVSNTTDSTGVGNGALVVSGGVGISKTVNIGGELNITGNSSLTGNVTVYGIETIQNTTDSHGVSNGAVVVKGGVGISKTVNIGEGLHVTGNSVMSGSIRVSGIETISNTTDSGSKLDGALIVSGGVGISKTVNIGGRLNVIGNSELTGNVNVSGIETISNTIDSHSKLDGALIVSGGVGISKTVNIGGNLNVIGNSELTGNVTVYGIEMIVNTTDSSNSENGALVVSGGLGISKTVNIGGNLNVTGHSLLTGNVSVLGIETIGNTTDSSGIGNGSLVVSGGVGISKTVNIGGNLNVIGNSVLNGNLTVSNDSTFSSNLSIYGDVTITGNITSNNNTNIYDLLVSPPPAVVFGTLNNSADNIYIPWTYPSQINVGALNIYLPAINSFSCKWSGNIGGTIKTNQTIIDNSGSSSFIKYTNTVLNPEYITGIALTNVSQTNGIKSIQFPQDVSGVKRNAYVFYSSDFANLLSDVNNKLTVWYSNYRDVSNVSSATIGVFLNAGTPSAPGQPTFGSQDITSNPVSVTVSSTVPQYSDTTNLGSSASIQSYKYIYSSPGSVKRYGGEIADASHNITNSSNSVSVQNLYPDCSYTFSVSAQNNSSNTAYGPNSSSILYTINMNPLASFGSISFTPGVTTYTASLVGTNQSGDVSNADVSNVFFSKPGVPWNSISFTSPIHYVDNRGSNSSNLLTISGTITQGSAVIDSSNLYYAGFPATKPTTISSTYFSIVSGTPTDSYSSYSSPYQGFYLDTSSSFTLNNNLFTASNNKTVVSLTQSQSGGSSNTSSYSFYYDDFSENPTISSSTISLNTTNYTKISGIYILYNNSIMNATTICGNIGRYFYNKDQILTYSTGQSETDLTNFTSGKYDISLNSSVTITNIGTPAITYTNALFSKSISISSTLYNPLGTTTSLTSNSVSVIYDQPSYDLITGTTYKSSIQTTDTNNYIYGFRISSGSEVTSGTFMYTTGFPASLTDVSGYNNNQLLSENQDLQIANGKYRSKGTDTNSYLDYSNNYYTSSLKNTANYATISTDTGYRYATFVWSVANSNYDTYAKVSFIINGIDATINNYDSQPIVDNSNLMVYYRFEDITGTFPGNSSTWFDINKSGDIINLSTYNDSSKILAAKSSTSNTFSSNTYTMNGKVHPFSSNNDNNYYVFLRICVPITANFQFTSVQCKLST